MKSKVMMKEDGLIIKKSHSLLDYSFEADKDVMPMEGINDEVHRARKDKVWQYWAECDFFQKEFGENSTHRPGGSGCQP